LSGYVVCASCGARIKAGRQHCLRCFEPLPDPDIPVKPPIWESLGLSQDKLMIFGIVASVAVLSLVAVIWSTWPDRLDDVAQPASGQAAPPRPTAAPAAPEPAPAETAVSAPAYQPAPAMAVDSNRTAAATFNAGDFASARAAYERSLVQRPDDPETLNNLGQVLVRMNQPTEAIARFERAIALAPTKSAYHFNLAHTVAQLGQLDRAVTEYREAVRLFPDDYATQFNLAMTLQAKGDAQGAIPEFQRAITLAPGEPSFHLSLGLSLEKVGRAADAVREYRQYLEMEPTSPDAAKLKAHIDVLSSAPPVKPSAA
jgi:Flp pilus assembly protein TadD